MTSLAFIPEACCRRGSSPVISDRPAARASGTGRFFGMLVAITVGKYRLHRSSSSGLQSERKMSKTMKRSTTYIRRAPAAGGRQRLHAEEVQGSGYRHYARRDVAARLADAERPESGGRSYRYDARSLIGRIRRPHRTMRRPAPARIRQLKNLPRGQSRTPAVAQRTGPRRQRNQRLLRRSVQGERRRISASKPPELGSRFGAAWYKPNAARG